MERRTGHDPQLVFGEGSARDTLDIVLVCLSLLLFTLLLSWRAARLQRDSMSACSGGGDGALLEIGGLRCAAGAWSCHRWPSFSSWHWRLGGALRIWEDAAGCSAGINVWASLLVLAAALLRYWDLTVIQPRLDRG